MNKGGVNQRSVNQRSVNQRSVNQRREALSARAGRPAATSRALIERTAFELFDRFGYEQTTMARISDQLGVGRRTVFRYYASKHDIAWGQFDDELPKLAALLAEQSVKLPAPEAVLSAVTDINVVAAQSDSHAARMRLILTEPTLQNHSAVWYVQWRAVISDFVADRESLAATDPWPRLVAYATNAVAIAAYAEWLNDPTRPVRDSFERARQLLTQYVGSAP